MSSFGFGLELNFHNRLQPQKEWGFLQPYRSNPVLPLYRAGLHEVLQTATLISVSK